jgi:hypothetical protein
MYRKTFMFPNGGTRKATKKMLLKLNLALGLLANLKETHEVKRACQIEATSIKSVVNE